MNRFPSAAQLISWAGLCPKNDKSAGKRRSTRPRPGAPWLKPVLVQNAWCAVRVKASSLHALFQRLKARRGPRKAIVAVAAAMLRAIYPMLKPGARRITILGPITFSVPSDRVWPRASPESLVNSASTSP